MFPQAPLPKEVGLDISALPIVRGAMAPPKLPFPLAKLWREAFAKAVKEPEFLNWAKRARVEITPMDHEEFLKYTLGVEKEVMKYLSKIEIKK